MRNRTQLALGIILIFFGGWFLAIRQIPSLQQISELYMTYPINVIAIGAMIFLVGLMVGAPGMAVPAGIVAGIGGILYYQFKTTDYTSWSFMWALIPGFAGVGDMVNGLLSSNQDKIRSGANAVFVSALLFLVFATLFGRLAILGPYAPAVILIVVGVVVLFRGYKK